MTEGDPATWTTRDGWASAPLALAISLPLPLPISTNEATVKPSQRFSSVATLILAIMGTALMIMILAKFVASKTVSTSHGDCRNRVWQQDGGDLIVMSWHIHFTTNASDLLRFQDAFTERFIDLFPPTIEDINWQSNRLQCPFGQNMGGNAYKYVCSLNEDNYTVDPKPSGRRLLQKAGGPWSVPQMSFHVPLEHIEETWWLYPNDMDVNI